MSVMTAVQNLQPGVGAPTPLRPPWITQSQSGVAAQPVDPNSMAGMNGHDFGAMTEGSQYAAEQMQGGRTLGYELQYSGVGESTAAQIQQQQHQHQQQQEHSEQQPQDKSTIQNHESSTESGRPHTNTSRKSSTQVPPVRRRISRACDQCNQLRTKCDGQSPCAHCIGFGLNCEYARERKKRGKVSKRQLAQQAAHAAAAAATANVPSNAGNCTMYIQSRSSSEPRAPEQTTQNSTMDDSFITPPQTIIDPSAPNTQRHASLQHTMAPTAQQQVNASLASAMEGVVASNGFPQISSMQRPTLTVGEIQSLQTQPTTSQAYTDYQDATVPSLNATMNSTKGQRIDVFRFPTSTEPPSLPFSGFSPPFNAPWSALPSPNLASYAIPNVTGTLKYPVLQPVLPHIVSIIPQSLACDLLDHYFSTSPSNYMCPQSPYVVGFFFRKQSIFHQTHPRRCSPALLASMLWIASQTSEAAFLTSLPSARSRVCQKLLELTISLLKPLIHNPAQGEANLHLPSNMVINGVALGGLNIMGDHVGAETSSSGALDDVITYMHIATVVSASEYKAASMRWWSAAYNLARELRLGRELPLNPPQRAPGDLATEVMEAEYPHRNMPRHVTEEEREERRRVWWMLYTMDRHLALCYNRPLSLQDRECETLLQPMSEAQFQAGVFSDRAITKLSGNLSPRYRQVGPSFEVTDHSMFGYFLPLMTILGEIIDLYHMRNHPRFGSTFRNSSEWDPMVAEITRQLEVYGQSLRDFDARYSNMLLHDPSADADAGDILPELSPRTCAAVNGGALGGVSKSGSTPGRTTESMVQTKIVLAYGTHMMHVLHILLAGKWDPISLLNDNDLWISSESFIRAMGHAVSAAEAAADILDLDPDLSFMPYFFGVYLLQGSFLLLLTADKLQGDASQSVVRACETIVRAHEACVVTLNTEYQRKFRKVMRSALLQVRGRLVEDHAAQRRRREVLSLYRWTGDGTGLAL